MKTRSFVGVSRGLFAASLASLTGCPDDVVNPFESAGTAGSSSSSGGLDDADDDVMMTTQDVDTTLGVDGSGTTTGAVVDDSGTTSVGEDSTTGADDGTTSTTGVGSSDSSSGDSSSDGPIGTPCPADVIDTVPGSYPGTTAGEGDEFASMCGGNGAPDYTFTLTAPSDGFYVFNTTGSALDTILYVLDGDCTGPVLACNDDTVGTSSEVGVALTTDQVVTVVVDSFGIGGGAFNLNVTFFEGLCPDGDIGNAVPQTTVGETVTGNNTLVGTCGGATSNDTSVTFTAPQDGIYMFDTIGSDFDTVLYVRDDCSGTQLGCNNNISGGNNASQVNVTMQQDDTVVVIVDGNNASGNYTLNVDIDACPDEALPSVAPQTVNGTTATDVNSANPSCGFSTNATDYAYTFVAPAAGTYIFDTFGSAYNTILYAYAGATCNGVSLACNDNTGAGTQSQIVLNLAQDEEVTVIVDGSGTANGAFTLNVDVLGGNCPDFDLGNSVPATVSSSTSGGGADDTVVGSCGGLGSNDDTYTFTVPADGTYFIDTIGSGYDTLLYVFDGAGCAGAELGCNNNALGGVGGVSGLTLNLSQDQVITIVVDGNNAEGNYTLNVDAYGGSCPDTDLGNTVPQTVNGNTTGGDNTTLGTCGGAFSNDDIYTFTAPAAGLYIFDTIGSAINTALYLRSGNDCSGAQLGCNTNGTNSVVSTGLAMDEEVTIIVDGFGTTGAYTLNVNVDACPDADLGMLVPQTVGGSTVGLSNSINPACGASNAPDYAYTFTAPMAGNYTFDTIGSTFDTVLHATNGNVCGGAALACNDDTFGLQSQIVLNLAAGQEIVVYVDGFSGASGNYTLNVN